MSNEKEMMNGNEKLPAGTAFTIDTPFGPIGPFVVVDKNGTLDDKSTGVTVTLEQYMRSQFAIFMALRHPPNYKPSPKYIKTELARFKYSAHWLRIAAEFRELPHVR